MPFGSLNDLGMLPWGSATECPTNAIYVPQHKRMYPYMWEPGGKCGPPLPLVTTPPGETPPEPGIDRLLELPTDLLRKRRDIIEIPSPVAFGEYVNPRERMRAMNAARNKVQQDRFKIARSMGIPNYNDPRVSAVVAVAEKWPSKEGITVDLVMKYMKGTQNEYYRKYGERVIRTLVDVWWNPSALELADLQLIDYGLPLPRPMVRVGRLNVPKPGMFTSTPVSPSQVPKVYTPDELQMCSPVPPPAPVRGTPGWNTYGQYVREWKPTQASRQPFFCPAPPKVENKNARPLPFPQVLQVGWNLWQQTTDERPKFWGIDLSKPWGEVKSALMRALVAEKAISNYPWPTPGIGFGRTWAEFHATDFKKYIMANGPKSWDDVRIYMALSILKNYNQVIGVIAARERKKAKKKKRRAIVRAVASLALGVVFAAFAPVAIAAAFSAVQTALDVKKKIEAAKDMAKAAKQFRRTDAAFADELDRVAALLEANAAAEEKATPMSAKEADAEAEAVGEDITARQGIVVVIEGQEAGHTDTAEAASALAQKTAKPGDRIEFVVAGKPTGLFLRTKEKFEKVPPEAEAKIRAMPPDQLRAIVMNAETKVPVATYAAIAVPLAAAVFL